MYKMLLYGIIAGICLVLAVYWLIKFIFNLKRQVKDLPKPVSPNHIRRIPAKNDDEPKSSRIVIIDGKKIYVPPAKYRK
jgi:hypothetical protein